MRDASLKNDMLAQVLCFNSRTPCGMRLHKAGEMEVPIERFDSRTTGVMRLQPSQTNYISQHFDSRIPGGMRQE